MDQFADITHIELVSLDWPSQGAEWQVRLDEAAAAHDFKSNSEQWSSEDGFTRRPIQVNGDETALEFCYRPLAEGNVLTFLIGATTADPELVNAVLQWRDASLEALTGVPTTFRWHAVLGTTGHGWFGAPFDLGELHIEPASSRHVEWAVSDRFPSLGGRHAQASSLVRVTSTARAHQWEGASRRAASDITLLAGFLVRGPR